MGSEMCIRDRFRLSHASFAAGAVLGGAGGVFRYASVVFDAAGVFVATAGAFVATTSNGHCLRHNQRISMKQNGK